MPERAPAGGVVFGDCFQAFKNFFSAEESGNLDYQTIRKRYLDRYEQIYTGLDLAKIKSLKMGYEEVQGGLGETDLLSHKVTIDNRLKNHPVVFIFQVHETQHYYDLKVGKLKCLETCNDVIVSNNEILDSEIRAHYRHLQAAKTLFSDDELNELLELEKDFKIRKFLKEITEYSGSPHNYIGMVLSEGGYLSVVKKAAQESGRSDYRLFLIERIEKLVEGL